jgi:hypothetical protein
MALGRKTGGRTAGTPNKRSHARLDAFKDTKRKLEKALGPHAFDGDAHALLAATYKDAALPLALRIDAAKAAIPYERPRLAAVAPEAPGSNKDPIMAMTEDTIALARELMRKHLPPGATHPAVSD